MQLKHFPKDFYEWKTSRFVKNIYRKPGEKILFNKTPWIIFNFKEIYFLLVSADAVKTI